MIMNLDIMSNLNSDINTVMRMNMKSDTTNNNDDVGYEK